MQEIGALRRCNDSLCQLYEASNVIRTIKVSRLRLAGHVKRMDENELARMIMEYKQEVKKQKATNIIMELKVSGWGQRDNRSWRKILREAEVRIAM